MWGAGTLPASLPGLERLLTRTAPADVVFIATSMIRTGEVIDATRLDALSQRLFFTLRN